MRTNGTSALGILGACLLAIPFGCNQPRQPQDPLPSVPTAPTTLAPPAPNEKAGDEKSPADDKNAQDDKQAAEKGAGGMTLEKSSFGATGDGKPVDLYTFSNGKGVTVKMINYGAIVVAVETPDRAGKPGPINLGFDSIEGYLKRHPYFGATVGRFANRIAKGKFTLDGKEYQLATNNGPHHLHGGKAGLDKVLWSAEPIETAEAVGVRFRYKSPDGEEGYPGNLEVTAEYTLTPANELVVVLSATSDKATPVNLTNHCYWNLAGVGSGPIYDQELMIAADKYLATDDTLIPTGELSDVAGTPLDFRTPKPIGKDLKKIKADPVGYDHCFVLRGNAGELRLAARVHDPQSGRVLEISTTQPGIQFYSGNFLDGSADGGGNKQHTAFCLETQHYPDSPNQPKFPTTILKPGETYRHKTVHKFSVRK